MRSHIVIEGYCFGIIEDPSHKPPCGQKTISSFCLLNGMCPHFSYCDSNEREAAIFVPLWAIIWDRIKCTAKEFCWKLRWYFWGKWFWKKEAQKWLDNMKGVLKVVECPAWDEQLKQAKDKFPEWFREALKQK